VSESENITEKEVVNKLLRQKREMLITLEIDEKFFVRKVLKGQQVEDWQLLLGKTQKQIKAIKDYISFLEEI